MDFTDNSSRQSELVLALVGGVGTDHARVQQILQQRLRDYEYQTNTIKISEVVLPRLVECNLPVDAFERGGKLMDVGNKARSKSHPAIAALGAIAQIHRLRDKEQSDGESAVTIDRKAYIISSLKRKEEVEQLRHTYNSGFYLIGVYSSPEMRCQNLMKKMTRDNADELMRRDEDEKIEFGQKTRATFHLADFFVEESGDFQSLKSQVDRIVDLIFGHPYLTPTFDEYAMFMAFAASLRSADLSRQVGAIIAMNDEVLSSGANDCPRFGGGLYWTRWDSENKCFSDHPKGRDFTIGVDTNVKERERIFGEISQRFSGNAIFHGDALRKQVHEALATSELKDLTEYGRMVHAEMEALLNCARNTLSCRGATLYATTFPCHNCAKHIIAAGIKEVVYVEPYPKSKAFKFHSESFGEKLEKDHVLCRPFIGVAARQFFDLFSMALSSGREVPRKSTTGETLVFEPIKASTRVPLRPYSYLQIEKSIEEVVKNYEDQIKNSDS